ncbi:GNAT family N-acetyltransferase [uncultured Granulicatella sp.]|uniref:GNAT family N-acetyltransferase n=1 Tax=uncultured Granulicatella sp. TaxID=316089 RepID=UPI0028F11584|nr:GNAT family N-acetyltransferase [uncultured Granulicatella sp.]
MIGYKKNDTISFEEIFPLYEAVGWTNYTSNPTMLKNALEHSLFLISARDEEGNLIGFLRAVGDGFSIVYIQDIIVLPEYQRQGIGTQLIRQTLEYFKEVYQMILTTDSELKTLAFYESNGFTALSKVGCTSFMANPLL